MVDSWSNILPVGGSNHDEAALCAGLPFVGWRDISTNEQEILNQECRRDFAYTGIWLILAGLSIVAPISIASILSSVISFSPSEDDILVVVIVATSLFGLTVSVILADKAFRRSRIARRTLTQGQFRMFKGYFDSEDPTDHERERLMENRDFGSGQAEPIILELHAVDDVIFARNGSRPQKWISVELTTAAPFPPQSARFNVPSDWPIPIEGKLERRRMTEAENEELLDYARQIRRWRWLQIFLGIWVVASLIRVIPTLTGLQMETAIQLGVVVAVAGSGFWYYWQGSKARVFEEDAELGWAIVIDAESANTITEREQSFTADVEVLASSGLLWIVKGRPAGWRRLRKAKYGHKWWK